jgi:hypothetical protein
MKKINPEIKKLVIDEFIKGIPIKNIATKYNIHRGTVRNYINNENIPLRKQKITKEKIYKMYELYLKGFTNIEIGSTLNIHPQIIGNYLVKEYNVQDSPSARRQRIRHNPFLDLKKDDVQYWLGYLCADGNIKTKGNEIRITSSSDINHIKINYINFIYENNKTNFPNKPLSVYEYFDKRTNTILCTISFSNKEVKKYLINLGITPNKTTSLCVNFNITYPFLRGVLDGDGTVPLDGRSCSIVTASKLFAEQISTFLISEEIKHSVSSYLSNKYITNNVIYTIRINAKNLSHFYKNLYYNSSYCLERKKSRFKI